MGCLCCKPSAIEDSKESPRERLSSKASSEWRASRVTSSRREEVHRAKDRYDSNDGRAMLIDKQANGSVRLHSEHLERKREKTEYVVAQYPGMGMVPKATEGEQIAAGWPSWLAAVAGEAIRGWTPRRADSFQKLDKVCSFRHLSLQSYTAFFVMRMLMDQCRRSFFSSKMLTCFIDQFNHSTWSHFIDFIIEIAFGRIYTTLQLTCFLVVHMDFPNQKIEKKKKC